MDEMKLYKLDKESIRKDFNFDKGTFRHSQCDRFKMLPYTANKKNQNQFTNFRGVAGEFSRLLSDKQLKEEFNPNEFIENVIDQIGEFEGICSEESFRDIIKNIFINKEELVDFDIKTINYISSTTQEKKNAEFLYSVFCDESLKRLVEKYYNFSNSNILYNLAIKALPKLKDKEALNEGYKCCLPFIRDLFKEDFEFLISNEELYKNSLKRFLEFYNMFYISQLALKLNKFEKADITKPDTVYYTLGFESLSKTRTAYKYGWKNLKQYADTLFSHAITLEMLNHNNLEYQLGYLELFEIFNNVNEDEIEKDIDELCNEYRIKKQDTINWSNFKCKDRCSGNKAFDKVYQLYQEIMFQFIDKGSTTKSANIAYKNWFIQFIEYNFGKRRGSLGYSLNLSEDDIILLTKICIKNDDKVKLNVLFEEFEKRGVSFDRDSKLKIIQLYEKLNLLEKKSDSGDAQYVRSIL